MRRAARYRLSASREPSPLVRDSDRRVRAAAGHATPHASAQSHRASSIRAPLTRRLCATRTLTADIDMRPMSAAVFRRSAWRRFAPTAYVSLSQRRARPLASCRSAHRRGTTTRGAELISAAIRVGKDARSLPQARWATLDGYRRLTAVRRQHATPHHKKLSVHRAATGRKSRPRRVARLTDRRAYRLRRRVERHKPRGAAPLRAATAYQLRLFSDFAPMQPPGEHAAT